MKKTTMMCFAVTLAGIFPSPGADKTDELVADGAEVRKLAGDFRFTEGPAWDGKGALYFTDIPNARIHKWADNKLSTFRENSGGANGLYFDREGNLVMCEGGARRISRATPDGTATVVVDAYDGKKLNSPNDLWIDPKGGIYFTDPRYGNSEGMEIDGYHVYYIAKGSRKAVRVIDDLNKPNGIIGAKDGKKLYVADAGGGKTYVYRVGEDGSVSERKLAAPEGSDGVTLDEKGNLYLTRGSVKVYSPEAKLIADIKTPESPANVTFGGPEGKILFITARTGLYSLKMKVKGAHH